MYSFLPLPVIDTLNSHVGFYMLVILCVLMSTIWYAGTDEIKPQAVLSAVVIAIGAAVSWNTGSIKTPANVQVVGKFVQFVAEGETVQERSGKTTVQKTYNYLYVVYQLDTGQKVILKASQGVEYPERVILYKN